MGGSPDGANFYGPQYGRMNAELAAEIRREAFGEDLGQESWRSAREQAEIAEFLRIGPESKVLDVACGAGGPSLALVQTFGCRLWGLDIEPEGAAQANARAEARGLADRASFAAADCSGRLPFDDESFDAVLCIDAICHLPDRPAALTEWRRLLRPGGRLVFTDPFVVTGPAAKVEIDGRCALGAELSFVPPGYNEACAAGAGLTLVSCVDRSAAVADIASRWHAARESRRTRLVREEGEDWYERRQTMLAASAELARTRRLSRFLYVAEKPRAPG